MSLSASINRWQDAPEPNRAALAANAPSARFEPLPGKRPCVVVIGDGSEAARNAARRAEHIAQGVGAHVVRVSRHTGASGAPRVRPTVPGPFDQRACANEEHGPEWRAGLGHAGLLVTSFGQEFRLSDLVLGTPVEQLVREWRIPVLVVRQPASRRYRRALVGVKLESPASALIAHARMLAPRARLEVVHVLGSSGEFRLRIADVPEAVIRSQRARLHRNASRHVNGLIAAAQDGTARAIVSRLSVGSAPDRLLQMSQGPRAELIVLGKRPRHWLADLVFDRGVARRMLAEGDADVLIVPDNA